MISVDAAREALLRLASDMDFETIDLRQAGGRVLASDLVAGAPQPPFRASSMDGYALAGPAAVGAQLRVVGEAAAGRPSRGAVGPGEAIRILTGAAVPDSCDRVVVQEAVRREGDGIRLSADTSEDDNIRAIGKDFAAGHRLAAGSILTPARVALAAAMGHGTVAVRRHPDVAIVMTGDELTWPSAPLSPGAIHASNGFGLAAMIDDAGARARILPIARDDAAGLAAVLTLARDADLVLTIGGASVGDHDLVAEVAADAGLEKAFHGVRMRPGKPLLGGRLGRSVLVGLPGNPVSALVCGSVFVVPVIRSMLGLPPGPDFATQPLAHRIPANGGREHYMRARREPDGRVSVFESQDSSLLSVLSEADLLVRRLPDDPAREPGAMMDTLLL